MIFTELENEKKIKKSASLAIEMLKVKDNLRWYRKQKHWSQEEMGNYFNLTRENIASYERGIAMPGLLLMSSVCRDLNVYLHEFIEQDLATYQRPADQPPAPAQLAGDQSLDDAIAAIQQGLQLLQAKSSKNRTKSKSSKNLKAE